LPQDAIAVARETVSCHPYAVGRHRYPLHAVGRTAGGVALSHYALSTCGSQVESYHTDVSGVLRLTLNAPVAGTGHTYKAAALDTNDIGASGPKHADAVGAGL